MHQDTLGLAIPAVSPSRKTLLGMMEVAQENYYASRPPIRNMDISAEIARLLRIQALQESIRQTLSSDSVT